MAATLPNDPNAMLRRRQTAEALAATGFPITEATLATKATRGGGPPYRSFGRTPLYRWGDARHGRKRACRRRVAARRRLTDSGG